ncbi:MAG: hypothetical protein KF716_16925 [Anaerolineae bacterium]|nr:hypothetical protein [Anaerolineae bacterium]
MKKRLVIILLIGTWLCSAAFTKTDAQGMCLASVPYAPQPADQAEVIDADVTLGWRVDCAATVELQVNGTEVATLDATTTSYAIPAEKGITTWQVIAIDAQGNHAPSPLWHFNRDAGGWLATPQPVASEAVIYTPPTPSHPWIDVNSPSVLASLICGSLCGGLGLVVVAAWALGLRAQRREHQRRWYR